MPNLLGATLFAVGCTQPAAEALEALTHDMSVGVETPLTTTLDPGQTLDSEERATLALRVQGVARWVMGHGTRTLSENPPGEEVTCEGKGRTITASAFNHDDATYPDVLSLREGARRVCTDFGLDGNVNDCQVYGEDNLRIFIDPRWRSNFPEVQPSIGAAVPTLEVVGEPFRLDHQRWFEDNVAVMEECSRETQ